MSIRSLKQRADRVASEARGLRLERDRRAAESLELARRRIGSPAGLALCFGAGFVVGLKPRKRDADDSAADVAGPATRMLDGPLGAAAIKLASAFIANAVVRRNKQGDGAGAPAGTGTASTASSR